MGKRINWTEQNNYYGLDYCSKKGNHKDYSFDIRYDYCGNSKIKPDDCMLSLTIYFKNRLIHSVSSMDIDFLINESEKYLQNEIDNMKTYF